MPPTKSGKAPTPTTSWPDGRDVSSASWARLGRMSLSGTVDSGFEEASQRIELLSPSLIDDDDERSDGGRGD